jgi:hypothetical protein
MTTTPRLAMTELAESQALPEATVNEYARFLEQGCSRFIIKDKDLATPPGSPADGDAYIVAASPTGAWAGKAKYVAFYMTTEWKFIAPVEGFRAYAQDEDADYEYDGSAWALVDTGGSAAWTLISSTSPSAASQVDVTGLSGYDELLIVARALTASVSGVRQIQVSVDNGSSFDTTAANYQVVSTAGVESNAASAAIAYHTTGSTAARTLIAHIKNLKGAVKACSFKGADTDIIYVGSSSDVDAIRVNNNNGGTITGGPVYVYGR